MSTVRIDWTEQYATDLVSRIDQSIETHLGIDAKKDLRDATSGLSVVQISVKRDLSFFKTQIDDDFKSNPLVRDEILNTLGFSKHLRDVQKNNQKSLIQVLYAFKKNMTDSPRNQITYKGLSGILIDKIIGYAELLMKPTPARKASNKQPKKFRKRLLVCLTVFMTRSSESAKRFPTITNSMP